MIPVALAAWVYWPLTGSWFWSDDGIATEVSRQAPGETVYLENGTNSTVVLGVMTSNTLFPGRAAIFLLANDDDRLDGRPVRFVERDQRILARYQQPASRLGRLLVPARP